MSYSTIKLQKYLINIEQSSWNDILSLINEDIGYIIPSQTEIDFFRSLNTLHGLDDISFSYYNLHNCDYIVADNCQIKTPKNISFCYRINKFGRNGKRFNLYFDGIKFDPSKCKAYFTCPACAKSIIIDLVAARCLNRKTMICGRCQKKLLHKTRSYHENYEQSMIEKHGAKRPMQIPAILEKMKQTMKKRHGYEFAMQSQSIRNLHQDNMQKKWGKKNWFCDTNPYEQGWIPKTKISNIEKTFVDEIHSKYNDLRIYSYQTKQFARQIDPIVVVLPDVYIPDIQLIIEFYGDYWHMNPTIYPTNILHPSKKIMRDELYQVDSARINSLLNSLGTNHIVHIVWEHDYRTSHEDVMQKLYNLIDERIKNANIRIT